MELPTLLLILALIAFLFAAIGWPASPRINLIAIGLFLFVASLLVTGTLRTP